MNSQKITLTTLALIGLIASPVITYAQSAATPSPTPNNVAQLLPLIYADKLTITSNESNTLKGTFEILNREDAAAVGAIAYRLMILKPASPAAIGVLRLDDGFTYSLQDSTDTFALVAGDTKPVSFTYPLPNLPAGDYRLRVQLMTTNDRTLGWDDAPFTISAGSPILSLEAGSVEANSYDPITPSKTGTIWAPLYGVNVDPGQNFKLNAKVSWNGTANLSVNSVVNRKRLLISNAPINKTVGGLITLKPGETRLVELPFKAPTQPGAYRFYLTFQNAAGQTVSSLGEFRVIVRGESASVVSAKVVQLHKEAGDTVQVQFTAVGSSDRETKMKGKLEASILDGNTLIGTVTTPIDLSLSAVSGTANVRLDKALVGTPQVRLTLYGTGKNPLDTYTIPLPGIPIVNAPFTLLQKIVMGFIALSVLILTTFAFILGRKKRHFGKS